MTQIDPTSTRWTTLVAIGLASLVTVIGCTDPLGTGLDDELTERSVGIEASPAPACSATKLASILAAATTEQPSVAIACSLSLAPTDVVTKKLVIQGATASGVTVACNGAALENGVTIRSTKVTDAATGAVSWSPPTDVTLTGCKIRGVVHVYGMAVNGEGEDLRLSSLTRGHTARAQRAAPTRIHLANLELTATGGIPLYVAPGVTDLELVDSVLDGESDSTAIYFDTESARNLVARNDIRTKTRNELFSKREAIAVDGSAFNRIVGNRFFSLSSGGIYLYRNCGEGGTVRHQSPRWNQLVNNVFYYDQYAGTLPAIWVASRNGDRSYCDLDDGYPFGSSIDDADLARHTVIAHNRIFKFAPETMIRIDNDLGHYVFGNATTIDSEPRRSGCFVLDQLRYLDDGESAHTFDLEAGGPHCRGARLTCSDGDLVVTAEPCPNVSTATFGCEVTASNSGCAVPVQCPPGERIVAAQAICNLESRGILSSYLDALPLNTSAVSSRSEQRLESRCVVGGHELRSGRARIITGGTLGETSFLAGCAEWDVDGGDCELRGQVWCGGI